MLARILTFFIGAFVSLSVAAGDTYRWEDADGNVYYSNALPPADARNVKRPVLYSNSSDQVLPYSLQLAVNRFPVTLYVTDCGSPCDLGRELLVNRGVPHTLMDASGADVQQELLGLTSGVAEVPVILIGRSVIVGFEEEQWNGALDLAGYPGEALVEVEPNELENTDPAASPGEPAQFTGQAADEFMSDDSEFEESDEAF